MATGVLVIGINKATKAMQFLTSEEEIVRPLNLAARHTIPRRGRFEKPSLLQVMRI